MTEFEGKDGTVRQAHYGAGRQPWDDIRDVGWGPEFCAGNILKYLRRPDKNPLDKIDDLEPMFFSEEIEFISGKLLRATQKHSRDSARWYWDRLTDMCNTNPPFDRAQRVRGELAILLTADELHQLTRDR